MGNDLLSKGINNILIIDDDYEEIRVLKDYFNNKGLFTYHCTENILSSEEFFDVNNTMLVILDLHLASDDLENAKSIIDLLSSSMKTKYFIFCFTKYQKGINELKQYTYSKKEENENLPVQIVGSQITKKHAKPEEIEKNIVDIINSDETVRLFLEMKKLHTIGEREFNKSIDHLLNKETYNSQHTNLDEYNDMKNRKISNILNCLDEAQGYKNTGQGVVSIYSRILENYLVTSPMSFDDSGETLNIKSDLESLINTQKLHEKGETCKLYPGYIVKKDILQDLSMIEKYFKSGTLLNIEDGKVTAKVKSGTYTLEFMKIKIIVTPFCDFHQNKHQNILCMNAVIVEVKESEYDRKKLTDRFENGVEHFQFMNNSFIVYRAKDFETLPKDTCANIAEIHEYYLSKEVVNDIQVKISKHISRLGLTTL